jgi:putative peptidoglycan lipid II flippase
MTLYRGFATVGAMTVISRVLGFCRDVLIAGVLGTGAVADAFFVAFRVPNMFRRLFAEGAFDSAFIPLFARCYHGEGERAAKSFAEQALTGLTIVLIAFTLLGEITMPWLMLALAPGFAEDPAKFDLAVLLARIALPYLLAMSLVALYTGVLNALGRFAIAALAPTLLNVVLIAVLVALHLLGFRESPYAGVALAWGIALAGFLQVIIVAFAAARTAMPLSWRKPTLTPEMKKLIALAAPGFIAGSITPVAVVIGTIIASFQDRVVSWLYFADRIYQLPLGVIGVAIGVVLLPELSHKLRAGDHSSAIESENRSLEFSLLLTVPAAVALLVASTPIVRVLFERGAFEASDADATALLLSAYAIGLPAFVMVKVFHPSYFARENTRTPMLFALGGMIANVLLSLFLFLRLGPVGIPLAASFSGWLNAALLLLWLRYRGNFALDAIFRRRYPAILLASILMGAVVWGLQALLWPYFAPSNGLIIQSLALGSLVFGGLIVYALAAQWLGAVNLRAMLKSLRNPPEV